MNKPNENIIYFTSSKIAPAGYVYVYNGKATCKDCVNDIFKALWPVFKNSLAYQDRGYAMISSHKCFYCGVTLV